MGRRLRRIIPGLPYHLTHRGNQRSPILGTDEQRIMYVSIMLRWQRKTGVRIAAFVIMPNHVHFIVVSPTEDALSKWIANGHREYSKWLNTVRGTSGHNWEERYFAVLMDPDHCLNALRYVEQNPVAASLTDAPWNWRWSSAAHHCGLGPKPEFLDLDLRPAGTTNDSWRDALLQPSSDAFRARLHECAGRHIALADEAWAREIEAKHGVTLLPLRRGRPAQAVENSPARFGRRNGERADQTGVRRGGGVGGRTGAGGRAGAGERTGRRAGAGTGTDTGTAERTGASPASRTGERTARRADAGTGPNRSPELTSAPRPARRATTKATRSSLEK